MHNNAIRWQSFSFISFECFVFVDVLFVNRCFIDSKGKIVFDLSGISISHSYNIIGYRFFGYFGWLYTVEAIHTHTHAHTAGTKKNELIGVHV